MLVLTRILLYIQTEHLEGSGGGGGVQRFVLYSSYNVIGETLKRSVKEIILQSIFLNDNL